MSSSSPKPTHGIVFSLLSRFFCYHAGQEDGIDTIYKLCHAVSITKADVETKKPHQPRPPPLTLFFRRTLWRWRVSAHSFVSSGCWGSCRFTHTGCSSNFCNGLRRLEFAFLRFQAQSAQLAELRLAVDENKHAEICRGYRIPGSERWRQKANNRNKTKIEKGRGEQGVT